MPIVMASFILAAPSTDAVEFSGSWLGKTNLPHFGPDEFTLILKKEKDSYTGMVIVDSLDIVKPDTQIQNIEVEGDVITFTFPLVDGTSLSCHLTFEDEKMNGYWSHSAGARGMIVFEKNQKGARAKYGDFIGDYKFVFEGEEALFKFYIKDGVLYGMGEYSLGELKPAKGNDLKFKVVTPHSENWSFEFIKDAEGKIVKCRFTDEDFPEMDSIIGNKLAK